MARGWESKSVESQIESAESRHSNGPSLSSEEANRQRARESIELSRTRVLQDLATATHPRYREQLLQSLSFLDAKLAALDAGTDTLA